MKRLALILLLGLLPLGADAAYRSVSCVTGTNDSATLPAPAGVTDGDELIGVVRTVETVTWSGFTPSIATATTDGGATRAGGSFLFRKRASSEPANYTVSIGGGNAQTFNVCVVAFSGRADAAPTVTATSDASEGASPEPIPLGGVTATAGDDILIVNAGEATNTTGTWVVNSVPASYTSRDTETDVGTFTAGFLNITTRDNVSGGATGTLTSEATLTTTQVETYGFVVALAASGGASSGLLLRRRRS